MVEDENDKKTNEGNDEGTEDNSSPENDPTVSPLDRADEINKEKRALLELENKTLDRREKIVAAESVSGRARSGTAQTPEEMEKEKNDARIKAIGAAGGAQWARD